MAKNLKLNIKNAQIAKAVDLEGIKNKLAKKKEDPASASKNVEKSKQKEAEDEQSKAVAPVKEEAPRIKARSRSAFAESSVDKNKSNEAQEEVVQQSETEETAIPSILANLEIEKPVRQKTAEELRKELFAEQKEEPQEEVKEEKPVEVQESAQSTIQEIPVEEPKKKMEDVPRKERAPIRPENSRPFSQQRLGPTGKHIKDLLPPKPAPRRENVRSDAPQQRPPYGQGHPQGQRPSHGQQQSSFKPSESDRNKEKIKSKPEEAKTPATTEEDNKKSKFSKVKEFRDVKPAKKPEPSRQFDGRDRHGLRADSEDETRWRKRRNKQAKVVQEDTTIRPTTLSVRTPITIKDLASEMKLKASQLVAKLFMQGIVVTLNDILEDETTIQLLGHEFGCEITIDTTEEKRIRITDETVKEEISKSDPAQLTIRPPVVAFMGHVDHGKTSLIDAIRKSNRAAGEAGAITQHIGAFRCHTAVGDIAILDTPGHEAFSAMRARGADVTDIVVLVVAGDEGIRQQTVEAIQHAKAANVSIVVAINKSDKPNFNPETVYRQLSEQELLPEAWGGQTITVNCSAHTGEGIKELLEMLALQAEVLELRANPDSRARGRVLESEMHKGMGAVATVLVQNGTLAIGDALVFGHLWGRVKTMQDEFGKLLQKALPSTPVEITGLSGLPEAGEEFIVVKNEKEAREIAEARREGIKESNLALKKKVSIENLLQQNVDNASKKILNVILRADVQGSLEALKVALQKVESQKAEINIIFTGVGEVSESDVQLAAASKAVIIGFHTNVESHAESLIRQHGVQVRMHDIIYHAIDDVKGLLVGLLDKISIETDKGKAEVKATFKSSHYGIIAGCQVIDGTIHRNNHMRVVRNKEVLWRGSISSLKRVKDDVREVSKGLECGIVLNGFSAFQQGDILEAYEVTYITQEL